MGDLEILSGHLSNWQRSKCHGKMTSGSHLNPPYDEIKVNRLKLHETDTHCEPKWGKIKNKNLTNMTDRC